MMSMSEGNKHINTCRDGFGILKTVRWWVCVIFWTCWALPVLAQSYIVISNWSGTHSNQFIIASPIEAYYDPDTQENKGS